MHGVQLVGARREWVPYPRRSSAGIPSVVDSMGARQLRSGMYNAGDHPGLPAGSPRVRGTPVTYW